MGMKKQLVVTGIIVMFFSVGLSGCNEVSNNQPFDKTASNPPIIKSFNVIPNVISEGESSTLSWFIINATYVYIDNDIGTVSLTGSKVITPTKTTTYTITAQNSISSIYSTTQITVKIATPSVELGVSFSSRDDTFGNIRMITASRPDIPWNTILCILIDQTNGGNVSWIGNGDGRDCDGKVNYFCSDDGDGFLTSEADTHLPPNGGNVDSITFMNPVKSGCNEGLSPGNNYKFTMYYIPTNEIMGTVSWTQVRY